MSDFEYIKKYYGVPARYGRRIRFNYPKNGPKEGTIVGTQNAHILVKFDGEEEPQPLHPNWKVEYA
jgi:hypothetical protein